jgi:hypothetical protein
MESKAKRELIGILRERYKQSPKGGKSKILDEFVAVTGHHRKYATRLLTKPLTTSERSTAVPRQIYNESVKDALVVLWEASDRICGKRLKAIIPELIKLLEGHNHLKLDTQVRDHLLVISAATIDRLLRPTRSHAKSQKRRRPVRKTRNRVSVRTFAEWDGAGPGELEIDFVAHCGGSLVGSFIHSFVVTDVCTGWTEATPLLVREQSLVVEGLKVLRHRLPIPLVGINSDNDSAFINASLVDYCQDQKIQFTRSRPYRKNDQAWIEQKNGAVVRRFSGYARYSGPIAGQTLAHLYDNVRLFVNYFQPSFKLQEKSRDGSKVKKVYSKPTTPCDRMLAHPDIELSIKETLRCQREGLDPLTLLHNIDKRNRHLRLSHHLVR